MQRKIIKPQFITTYIKIKDDAMDYKNPPKKAKNNYIKNLLKEFYQKSE